MVDRVENLSQSFELNPSPRENETNIEGEKYNLPLTPHFPTLFWEAPSKNPQEIPSLAINSHACL
jgi:hypothetical protein